MHAHINVSVHTHTDTHMAGRVWSSEVQLLVGKMYFIQEKVTFLSIREIDFF